MKWEYTLVSFGNTSGDLAISMNVIQAITTRLDKVGLEGWELVSVDNGLAYFKRPLRSRAEDEIMKHFDTTRSSLV